MRSKDYLVNTFDEYVLLSYPQVPEEFGKVVMFSTMSQEQEQNPVIVEKIKKVFVYQDDADDYACSNMEKQMPLLLWGKKTLIDESQILPMTTFEPFPRGTYNDPRRGIITSKKDLTEIYQKEGHGFLPKTYFTKEEAKKNLKFPMIAKSLNSFQSRGVEKVNNAKELDALSDEYDIFQEQIKISHEYRFLFFKGYKTETTLIAGFHRAPVNDKAKGLREAMTFDSMKEKEASEFAWSQITIFEFGQKPLFDIAEAVFKHNPGLNVVGIDVAYENGDLMNPYYIEQNITPSMIANVPFLVYKFIYEDAYYPMSPYTISRLEQLSVGYMIKRFKEDDLFDVDAYVSGMSFSGFPYSEMLNSKPA
jgi:hypothetical protein